MTGVRPHLPTPLPPTDEDAYRAAVEREFPTGVHTDVCAEAGGGATPPPSPAAGWTSRLRARLRSVNQSESRRNGFGVSAAGTQPSKCHSLSLVRSSGAASARSGCTLPVGSDTDPSRAAASGSLRALDCSSPKTLLALLPSSNTGSKGDTHHTRMFCPPPPFST